VDVVCPRPVQAVPFVLADARLPEECARPDIPPLPVHLLPDLPAHRGLEPRQVRPLVLMGAVRDGERGVIERIRAFRISIRTTDPALDTAALVHREGVKNGHE